MSSRAAPVPSLAAVMSCAVENMYACDLPQWFHVFFASRSCFKHKNIYIHMRIYIFIHIYIHIYICICIHMHIYTCMYIFHVHVHVRLRVRVGGIGALEGSGGGWVGVGW